MKELTLTIDLSILINLGFIVFNFITTVVDIYLLSKVETFPLIIIYFL